MKVELRYGAKNSKGKKSQRIYIRIKHSNLDWDKSLGIQIEAEDWNFKKREIITHKALNNPLHTEHLQEKNRKVYDISKHLQYACESFYHTNRTDVQRWVQEKNRTRWREQCEKWYNDYLNKNKVITQPYFMEAYNSVKETLSITSHGKDTIVRWDTIGKNLEAFFKAKGKIRTDEFSQNVWNKMVLFFRNEYKHRDNTNQIGLSEKTIYTILKKIRVVKNQGSYVFHSDMNNFTLKDKKKKFDTLNPTELNQLWEYIGSDKNLSKTKTRKWFFQIQYYGCFRISEIYLNLLKYPNTDNPVLKTPKEIWENEVYQEPKEKYYRWKCLQVKQNGEVDSKSLPISDKLMIALFGSLENCLSDNFPKTFMVDDISIHKLEAKQTYRRFLKTALKDLGINKQILTHDMRKSFITNQIDDKVKKRDIMQYSGHKSESAFNIYINDDDSSIDTDVKLKNI